MPIWFAAMGPKNARRTAERGWHLGANYKAEYDEGLADTGRSVADHHVAPMKLVCVADSAHAAWEIAGPGLRYFVNYNVLNRRLDGSLPPAAAEATIESMRGGSLAGTSFNPIFGSPDDVRAHFEAFRDGAEGRATHVRVVFRHPLMSNADVRRSMDLFAHEVLPLLR
jgi:alkanesulfonate monooxygenase SsuD/methylene tetrahydromethanopterin reductase-like flavin-dependent oxidoreductase (luciferase family)